ncbi:uncharacterized protein HKW66_Vig0025840 [Vigna angularis]|uniref:Uncharacterized protein n=1 Tax=Phaseolus angularis TaxID=3914 RepID=A0A8T0L859_PHAAN|nr:uncharacterized protein HKW66_Vig0025840 [Vigna angularis]
MIKLTVLTIDIFNKTNKGIPIPHHKSHSIYLQFCKIMGSEIDTKSIEPVRNAVSLFGDKGDQKKYQAARSKSDCGNEFEELTKELANCKFQLEAKHAAHMQALLKLEHSQKMIHELSTLLKKSDIERNKNMSECSECRSRKGELESKMKEMVDQSLEAAKVRDQFAHVLSELKATQRELLNKETELVAARDSEMNSLTKAKQLESALEAEKEQKEELVQQVKELNEAIHNSKLAAIESEREKLALLSEKDEQIDFATKATAQQQVKVAKKEINALSITNESLTSELQEANAELNMNKESDIETQVEIALLKSKLQEHRVVYNNGKITEESTTDHSKAEAEERNSEKNNEHVTGKSLFGVEGEVGRFSELALMKKELENASVKISELRARAEQALSRAEFAENAKTALEEKIRRHREHRQRRRLALTALREESTPKPFSPSSSYGTPGSYQPLGKVLNMKL